MARPLRTFVEGFSWHVRQRGVNRGLIFKAPSDYRVFLSLLRYECERHGVQVHAYALMRNHIHLLATPQAKTSLPLMMQGIGRTYVPFFNHKYKRIGTLWESRYKGALVHDERYWLTCMRYVELNAVRAGIAAHAGQYRWSSYWHHGVGHFDPLITEHTLYLALGSSPDARQHVWREMCGHRMSDHELKSVRDAFRRGVVIGEPLEVEVR